MQKSKKPAKGWLNKVIDEEFQRISKEDDHLTLGHIKKIVREALKLNVNEGQMTDLGSQLQKGVKMMWGADNAFRNALSVAPDDATYNAIEAIRKAVEQLAFNADGKMQKLVHSPKLEGKSTKHKIGLKKEDHLAPGWSTGVGTEATEDVSEDDEPMEKKKLDPGMYSHIKDREAPLKKGSELKMKSLGGGGVGGHGRAELTGLEDLEEEDVDEGNPGPPDISEEDIDEVTPPGGEKVVRALKKQRGVKNPWAVAWSLKNKGAHFKK